MTRRPFFSFFSLFSVFFSFSFFLSFFEKQVNVRYRQQRACDADAQEHPARAAPGTPALGVGARGLCVAWPRVAPVGERWVPGSAGPLRSARAGRRPNPAPHKHRPGGAVAARGWRGFPFACSVSLWICRLAIAPSARGRLAPNRATHCAPALSDGRAGRKKQVVKGQRLT